jgi:hypothetical protein
LEFWPEYRGGPLWNDQGQSVDLANLPVSDDLRERVADWVSGYADEKLPMESTGDAEWLAVGTALLAELRLALQPDYDVVVTEPWWGEEPAE